MKILFTSAGRRVELVQAFRNAAERLKTDLKIYGADISETAPALYFCDESVIVSRIREPGYIPGLLRVCEKEKIDCLIPTIDTDLIILAENREHFESIGTEVLISDIDKIRICRDKRHTADYFSKLGLNTPSYSDDVDKYDAGFPAFIKPRDGSSSIDTYKVESRSELESLALRVPNYIIQPFISGREYTVDIFCDLSGNPIYITPRERLATRSGEVLKTRICQDDVMIDEMKLLVEDFKPRGQITVQLIHDEKSGKNYYLEINPRFGGGAPLSMKAGADSAAALIRILSGEKLKYVDYAAKDGAVYSRFDQSVCVDEGVKKK